MSREAEQARRGTLGATAQWGTLGAAMALMALVSCNAILGVDQDYVVGGGGATSSTSIGGTGTTGGGAGGTGGETSTSTGTTSGSGGGGGASTILLMDYDDGSPGNGVHEADLCGGGFDDTSATTDSSQFSEHTVWFAYDATQDQEAAKTQLENNGAKTDGSIRSGVLTDVRVFHASTETTGYTFASGDSYVIHFVWRDVSQWDDATSTITIAIGYYDDEGSTGFDPTTAAFTVVSSVTTETSTIDATWEEAGGTFPDAVPSAAAGKSLYVRITATDAFARVDNITLTAHSSSGP
ncbi:MAG: hypothetical protein JRI23_29855 [Deltaproteobacteria bacterium]|jgi:hypothetical protein|nr:hypothetical protein [Deltaproteobacteria bacterium]MBW2536356.1 hypothetical protein [Deltaproteobacteria bacterium]